jgi:beta-galactosidase
MVQRFNAAQVTVLRAHSPGRDILHNYMGLFTEFDHFAVGTDLDVATWDSYPLGFLQQGPFPADEKQLYLRLGHPDLAAFHHDLYRAVGHGRWWVIEQQPGPVNWAPWNPAPAHGAIRLWAWEALAHGAERVSWFRWRQAPTGQEAMHAGLLRPDDQPAPAFAEVAEVANDLKALGRVPESAPAKVALLFDYDAIWGLQAQPQGKDYDGLALALQWHGAIRRLGLDVDVLPVSADLTGYALVLLPAVLFADAGLAQRLAASGATVLAGPRTGAKTRDFAIPPGLPPDGLQALIDIKVTRVESLPPGISLPAGNRGSVQHWMEDVEGAAAPLVRLDDGRGLLFQQGRAYYLAGWADAALLDGIMADVAEQAGFKALPLPPHTRLRRRGDWHFLFNFGAQAVNLPPGLVKGPVLLGQQPVPSGGVLMWKGRA